MTERRSREIFATKRADFSSVPAHRPNVDSGSGGGWSTPPANTSTLQADPLTNDRYAFAGGNPVNRVEFDGHMVCRGSADCGSAKRGKRAKHPCPAGTTAKPDPQNNLHGPSNSPDPVAPPRLLKVAPLINFAPLGPKQPRQLAQDPTDLLPEGGVADSARGSVCGLARGFFLGGPGCIGDENTQAFQGAAHDAERGSLFAGGAKAAGTGVVRGGRALFGAVRGVLRGSDKAAEV